MRVLIDYRAALRERSGVGEYTHQLVRALLAATSPVCQRSLSVTLFSSSFRDRLRPGPELSAASVVDRRLPVRLLNFAWHRLELPAVEFISRAHFDVVHSLHPLLMPAKRAAQVVTIHDLNFLLYPERTRAEIRRDYPALAREHAHRADRVIVVSEFTAAEVVRLLQLPRERISVCAPGAPPWLPRRSQPRDGYVLFLGTLEPRKNVGALLDAYEQLASSRAEVPALVLAGKAAEGSAGWLERIDRAPLRGIVRHIGYVEPEARQRLYEGARLLVQPSFEEGFGLPVLEAMTLGVPVVAANRGALPEVLGDAGPLVDPNNPEALAAAIASLLDDPVAADAAAARGVEQAKRYTWEQTARGVYAAYQAASAHRAVKAGAA